MDFKTFFHTIKEYGDILTSPADTAAELYQYVNTPVTPSTAEAYYKGKRTSKIERGKIFEPGFFRFFHERTHTTWCNVQKAFENLDQPTVINFTTKNENEFYESLLAEFYEIVRSGPTSLRHILPIRSKIFGREKEVESIRRIILEEKAVVLTGIGGIGKSQLALECAYYLNRDDRVLCQHLICEDDDTLRDAILKLQFDNPAQTSKKKKDGEKFSDRLLWLKNRNRPTLIILDNLNYGLTGDDRKDLSKLLDCGPHIHILITSRNAMPNDGLRVIQIRPLDDNSLLNLYAYHRFGDETEGNKYIEKNKVTLLKAFSVFDRHTLITILLAKLPSRSFMSDLDIYIRLTQGFQLPQEAVSLQKDSNFVEGSAISIIKRIFDISGFEEAEKHALSCLSMMPLDGVGIKMFERLTDCMRRTILDLRDYNWIIIDNETLQIRLHPLICEVILTYDELFPSDDLSQKIVDRTKCLLENPSSEDSGKLKRILLCVISRIKFRKIVTYKLSGNPESSLFDQLKDEYTTPLSELNALLIAKANKK